METSLNPKVLLHDSHMSSDGGEILWYGEPFFSREQERELFVTKTARGLLALELCERHVLCL